MACELELDHMAGSALFGIADLDRNRLPLSRCGPTDETDILARLAYQLSLEESGSKSAHQQGEWRSQESANGAEALCVATEAMYGKKPTFYVPGSGSSGRSSEAQVLHFNDSPAEERFEKPSVCCLSTLPMERQNEQWLSDGEGKGSEGEGKPSKTREKNRRAQQRFRQRQKAKLQAKEHESIHMQKQIQDLQAQLLQVQISGSGSGSDLAPMQRQQLEQTQSRCQTLQAENSEMRALALRLIQENKRLLMERTQSFLPVEPGCLGTSSIGRPALMQKELQQLAGLPSNGGFDWSSAASKFRVSNGTLIPRAQVFLDVHQVPWQIAPFKPASGLPVGCSPGGWQLSHVLLKLLSKSPDGSTTSLIKFPPGFEHDYVIFTETQTEEALILQGSMTDTVLNCTFRSGDYCCICPGLQHGPYRADKDVGALCFVITRVGSQTQ